jgi:hypothetical protein
MILVNVYEHALMTYTHPTLANTSRGQPMLGITLDYVYSLIFRMKNNLKSNYFE